MKEEKRDSRHKTLTKLVNPLEVFSVMERLVARAKPPGIAPGTLVHTGKHWSDVVHMTAIDYNAGECVERALNDLSELDHDRLESSTLWLNVDGLHDVELIRALGERYNVHNLTLEDVLHVGQRPKADESDAMLYVVLHMLRYDPDIDRVDREQISLLLGQDFVISLQERVGDVFDPVRARLREGGRARERGPDFLLYALIDAIVDAYYVVLEQIGEDIERLDAEVMVAPRKDTLRDIYELKRELLVIRRAAWPVRELVNQLLRSERDFLTAETRQYMRDVYDHAVQVMDTIETLRDLTNGLADLYLTSLGQRTNEVMKVLTIMSSIFIPLTFLAGIYGMNFEHMPELRVAWAYPVLLTVMGVMSAAMIVYFKRKDWF